MFWPKIWNSVSDRLLPQYQSGASAYLKVNPVFFVVFFWGDGGFRVRGNILKGIFKANTTVNRNNGCIFPVYPTSWRRYSDPGR